MEVGLAGQFLAGVGAGGASVHAGWRRGLVSYVHDEDLFAFSRVCAATYAAAATGMS